MKNKWLWVHIAAFTVALIYGINYTITKEVTPEYIKPYGLVMYRVLGAIILFWIFTPKEPIKDKKDFLSLAICALFGVTINQLFFIKGLSMTVPTNAAVIMTTTPILVLIISSFWLKDKITIEKLAGVLLGMIGAILILTDGGKVFSGEGFRGDIFIFLNALSYGTYLVLVKPLLEKYSAMTIIKWIFTFGFLFVIPFGFQEAIDVKWNELPAPVYGFVAYIIICTTFFAYLLNGWALKHSTPNIIAFYIYLQPIIATAIALLFRGDPLTWKTVAFTSMIFLGVYLVGKNKKSYS